MKKIKYTILYCFCDNFCDSILLQFRNRDYIGSDLAKVRF